MEPQIHDYYNEFPHGVNVIEKLNDECDFLLKKLDEKDKEIERLIQLFKILDKRVSKYKREQELKEIIRIINEERRPREKKFSCF
tara:strand:- start:453 stop:707 length:255 start_codon:yes stop_codon:yes gene_type:complete